MNATDHKITAQDLLMHHMLNAFYGFEDMIKENKFESSDDIAAFNNELKRQINRIEKLFGYKIGSWKA